MEINHQRVDFPLAETIKIRNTYYTVAAHFDDTREPLPEKLARFLQKDIQKQGLHIDNTAFT